MKWYVCWLLLMLMCIELDSLSNLFVLELGMIVIDCVGCLCVMVELCCRIKLFLCLLSMFVMVFIVMYLVEFWMLLWNVSILFWLMVFRLLWKCLFSDMWLSLLGLVMWFRDFGFSFILNGLLVCSFIGVFFVEWVFCIIS